MMLETWRSSIFCPRPVTPLHPKEWRKHARRFAISYRLRTAQWERKQKFEGFVKKEYAKHLPAIEIARPAVSGGLWPYGTEHGGSVDEEDRIRACRSAVYRVIKKISRGR